MLDTLRKILLSPIIIGGEEFPFTLSALLFRVLLPLLLCFVLYRIILKLLLRLLRSSKIKHEIQTKIHMWVRRILRLLYAVLFISLAGRLLGAEIFYYVGLFFSFLSQPFFESGSTRISIVTLILIIPVFYVASWVARVTRGFVNRSVLEKIAIDEAKKFSISNLIRYGVMVIVVLIGLSLIGLNLSSLAVIFGVLGIGVGFGLQSMVSNFFAGIVIILTRPIKEGDRVLVANFEGTVDRIRLLSTVINTLTNESIIVPNSQIIGDKVYNYSYEDRRIIIVNIVQISYASDLEKALEVLVQIGRDNPFGIKNMKPYARVWSFADSGIELRLFTWVHEVIDKYEGLSWANLQIWRRFREQGIEIPFPQLDLHIKG
ncbi:MAG: mechanosensitive ion channel protein MscS [Spirochaetes bacterium]|nr:MAG: mechanosensitive ion channel protein MscS [Spirochaetota bacterium]